MQIHTKGKKKECQIRKAHKGPFTPDPDFPSARMEQSNCHAFLIPVWPIWAECQFGSAWCGHPFIHQCASILNKQHKHQRDLQVLNVTQKEQPMTEDNFLCVADCTQRIGCSFWVTFHSWSYVWCLNCRMTQKTFKNDAPDALTPDALNALALDTSAL